MDASAMSAQLPSWHGRLDRGPMPSSRVVFTGERRGECLFYFSALVGVGDNHLKRLISWKGNRLWFPSEKFGFPSVPLGFPSASAWNPFSPAWISFTATGGWIPLTLPARPRPPSVRRSPATL